MHMTRIGLLAAMMVMATAATVQADDPSVALCLATIDQTTTLFDTFPGGVPAAVAGAGAKALYAACYRPDPSGESSFHLKAVALDKVCSGGGSTVSGWSDSMVIGDQEFHIANGPASSYTTYFKDPNEDGKFLVEGTARSLLDDMSMVISDADKVTAHNVGYWFFADIPMGGHMSVDARCAFGLVTSTNFAAGGIPLGASVLRLESVVFEVRAGGTTCVVPC